jgi:uncharacterized protein YdeI (YjbR/CyaY-like superfamily)
MPPDVQDALARCGVSPDYEARPPYQRNDYIGWINLAKSEETRQKRIDQMVTELKQGGVYMGMVHAPSRK